MKSIFDYHLKGTLRTKQLAPDAHLDQDRRLRAAWSNAKHALPSRLLKIQHRIIILN